LIIFRENILYLQSFGCRWDPAVAEIFKMKGIATNIKLRVYTFVFRRDMFVFRGVFRVTDFFDVNSNPECLMYLTKKSLYFRESDCAKFLEEMLKLILHLNNFLLVMTYNSITAINPFHCKISEKYITSMKEIKMLVFIKTLMVIF
jgi:hypothetical protein